MEENNESKKSQAELKLDLIEYIDKRTKEIKDDRKSDFKNLLTLVLAVLTFLGLGTAYGIHSTIGQIKEKTDAVLKDEVAKAQQRVSKRMDDEFSKEEIQKLMMASAKEAVKGKVEDYISKKVDETIKPYTGQIKGLKDFESTVKAAEYGSIRAYYDLIKISKTNSYFKDTAKREITLINNDIADYKSLPREWVEGFTIVINKKDVDVASLTTAGLFSALENPDIDKFHKQSLMQSIIKKPKAEIINEALRILKASDSMPAVAATCGILEEIYGSKAGFLDRENWIRFCEKEKTK